MTDKQIVEEYDTLIGYKEESSKPATLSSFLGLSDGPETEEEAWEEDQRSQNWKQHWKGMPSYSSENFEPVKQLIINFRTMEDYNAFAEVLKQTLTPKTKSVYWPFIEKDNNSLKRWIEAE